MPRPRAVKTRKIPQQKRAQETVDLIVETATHICRERGYEATNVNEVARIAGVSVGSLYQYFPSKELLVTEVARRLGERMTAVFQDGVPELAFLPLEDAVRGIVRRLLLSFAVDPELRRALDAVPTAVLALDVPGFDETLAEALTSYFAFKADSLRPTNHKLAARVLMRALESVAVDLALHGYEGTDREEVERELSALVLGYLLPVKAP
jgi:AcrR family transcriptional regulator